MTPSTCTTAVLRDGPTCFVALGREHVESPTAAQQPGTRARRLAGTVQSSARAKMQADAA